MSYYPWVQALAPSAPVGPVASKSVAVAVGPQAGDWFDPTVESHPQTLNEAGFITSPFPAPVDPATGKVPLTDVEIAAWIARGKH